MIFKSKYFIAIIIIISFLILRIYKSDNIPVPSQEEIGNFFIQKTYIEKEFPKEVSEYIVYGLGSEYFIMPVYKIIKLFNVKFSIFHSRLISSFFQLINFIIIFFIVKKTINEKTAFFTLLLMLVSPNYFIWGRTNYYYFIINTYNLLSTVFILMFFNRSSYKYLILALVFIFISIYIHPTSILYYTNFIVLIVMFKNKEMIDCLLTKNKIKKIIIVFIMMLFALITFFTMKKMIIFFLKDIKKFILAYSFLNVKIIFRDIFYNIKLFVDVFSGYYDTRYFFGGITKAWYVNIIVIINFIIILTALYHSKSKKMFYLICTLIIYFFSFIILKTYVATLSSGRYFYFVLPFYYILLGYSISYYMIQKKFFASILLFINIFIGLFIFYNYYINFPFKYGHRYNSDSLNLIKGFSRREAFAENEYGAWEFFRHDESKKILLEKIIKDIADDNTVENENKKILCDRWNELNIYYYIYINDSNLKFFKSKNYDIMYKIDIEEFDKKKLNENDVLYIVSFNKKNIFFGEEWREYFLPHQLEYIERKYLVKKYYSISGYNIYTLYKIKKDLNFDF